MVRGSYPVHDTALMRAQRPSRRRGWQNHGASTKGHPRERRSHYRLRPR